MNYEIETYVICNYGVVVLIFANKLVSQGITWAILIIYPETLFFIQLIFYEYIKVLVLFYVSIKKYGFLRYVHLHWFF